MKIRRMLAGEWLLLLLAASGTAWPAQTSAPAPAKAPAQVSVVEGTDYVRIKNGAPFATAAGKIEVAEFFNYACPACNAFNPLLRSWQQSLPADVHVVFVPVDFRPDFVQYAHAYYAAEALGVLERSHDAVYTAIHQTHALPGEGGAQDPAVIAKFYAQYGVKAADFQSAMGSFSVNMKTTAARTFAQTSEVGSTPTLVVNGRYRVNGKSWTDMLRIASALVAQVRSGAR